MSDREENDTCEIQGSVAGVGSQVGVETPVASAEVKADTDVHLEPRRGERVRSLTEKGKELQEEKIRGLKKRFQSVYERWKSCAETAKESQAQQFSNEMLQDLIEEITNASSEVRLVYEELRKNIIPDGDTRRRTDVCEAVTHRIVDSTLSRIQVRAPDQQPQDEEYICDMSSPPAPRNSRSSHHSKSISRSGSNASSKRSSLSSLRKIAAAEVAATQAALEIMKEKERHLQEIEKLETENRQRIAQQQAENAARRKAVQEKRRELERLEAVKKLNAAKARMEIYEQDLDADIRELLQEFDHKLERPFPTAKKSLSQLQSAPPVQPATGVNHDDNTMLLIKTLAESISASRLPIPEPVVFIGDPLRFKDWKMSFHTLIDRKAIQVNEKIYYLRKYVGGPAKTAIESYFLLGTESAYHAAWEILEERYGSPFVIAKAFRDKLDSWPKIGPKDSCELREFADFLRSCEAATPQIKSLEILSDCNENQKIISRLPDWLTSRWNRRVVEIEEATGAFPTFKQFVDFVTKEAKIACNPVTSLHALKSNESQMLKTKGARTTGAKVLASSSAEERNIVECVFCESCGHDIHICQKFMENAIPERVKFVQTKGLCFGCLKPGHHSKACGSRSVCKTCKGKHPTILHQDRTAYTEKKAQFEERKGRKTVSTQTNEESTEVLSAKVLQNAHNTHTSTVIPVWLSTTSEPDREVLIYALLDTQSDTTFVLQEVADSLVSDKTPVQLKLSTMASRNTVVSCQRLTGLQVRGFSSVKKITLPVTYSRDFIPANKTHISTPQTAKAWPHLEHIAPEIAPLQTCDIGLLIGYNCPQALLPREVVSGKDGQPFAQRTDLGWSIVGCSNPCIDYGDAVGLSHRIVVKEVTPILKSSHGLTTEVRYSCQRQIKELATPPDILKVLESDFNERSVEDSHISQEDLRFLSIMEDGIRLKDDGHYEMPLPFKETKPELPDNKICAIHRLKSLERRLKKDDSYFQDYVAFMTETIARGDAEKVPVEELNRRPVWYIPHHGVYHPQKPRKIRIVFDCSAKFEDVSLNDYLLTGPELTNGLVGVLCRFRKAPIAIMCDIERMFHQFHVKAEDQDYFRFLWWDNGNLEAQPAVYRMKVHLFGAASSPGCANFGLRHIAAQGQGSFSESAIKFIERNFYVDDGLTSVSTVDEAIQLVQEVRQLCSTGKLRLHKFVSNSQEVMASIPQEECANKAKDLNLTFDESHIERALGIQWCIASDDFQFRIIIKERPLSRRGVLSTVASIYDPLGFVAPFVLIGKKILQQMCRERVGWDEPLSDDLRPQWEAWLLDLSNLADIKIQRCHIPSTFQKVEQYELHHFCDASVSGYGQCTYLRVVNASGEVHCSLVMGKARVTPTKVTTIPRLELSSAVVAVRTSDLLRKELEIKDLQEQFWTDSRVVLGYINNEARRFHVFVANRIQRIKQSTDPKQWSHVRSEDNPADYASRGLMAKELIASDWFTGPSFLWQSSISRDVKVGEVAADDPELKRVQTLNTHSKENGSLLDRLQKFSDWGRVVKAIARLKRHAKVFKGLKARTCEKTSLEERKEAEFAIIQMVQESAFSDEIQRLKGGAQSKNKDKTNRLYRLCPFLDDCGMLRVGGRLEHAALHPEAKHPVVLPRDSHVSNLLIKHHHERVQHQGRGMTMNELRSNGIWIIGCSSAVSSYIYKCTQCRKFRRCTEVQRMGNLPSERLEATPPFAYCGIDCFGPFYIKEGRKDIKRYGLLLTCLCSRAVHIEVLDDLSTDAFINSLRAFIAIRGPVRQLRSDQGTNFVGARREFMEALRHMDQECLKQLGCEFVMNIPGASHMGGAWERQIRTVRSVLTSILDQSSQRLDSSSLRTYFYEVMAIVNSRPLTTEFLSDPSGPQPLTPNHILTMKSSVILPPPGQFEREDLYLRKRWRRVQYLANEFWSRWKKEYLLNLQHRQKWQRICRNARIGDIVILKEETTPRNQWKLAKVTEVYPGEDGCVRKVKLLIGDSMLDARGKRTTPKAVYLERPIHKTVTLVEAD